MSVAKPVKRAAVTPVATVPARSRAPADAYPKLITDITVEHGPPELLGRFFLRADTAARERGVTLSFGTFEELIEINARNSDSWKKLSTLYDVSVCPQGLAPERAFVIFGRDGRGEVVATHAARIFDLDQETLYDLATSLRMIYDDPARMKRPTERCEVTASIAKTMRGKLLMNGAVWYHPAYRKRQLSKIIPRISRSYAYTRWKIDNSMGLVMEGPTKGGVIDSLGYPNRQWDLKFIDSSLGAGAFSCCLAWMDADQLLEDLADWLGGFGAQVYSGVDDRRAQQQG
jgi:hypothetical protein